MPNVAKHDNNHTMNIEVLNTSLILAISLILLASCEKEYKCRCMITNKSTIVDSVTYKDVVEVESYELLIKSTKKALKNGECSNYKKNTVVNGNAIRIDKNCTINTQ